MDGRSVGILLRLVFRQFRKMRAELFAHQMALETLKRTLEPSDPGFAALADVALDSARTSPALRKTLQKRYDEPLEKFLQQVDQAATEEEVEKLLRATPLSKFEN